MLKSTLQTNPSLDASTPVDLCVDVLESGAPTATRREAISAIGRRRDRAFKPILVKYSDDRDPDVVLQAIRGLLAFKDDSDVMARLLSFSQHPNDMIRDIVHIELNGNADDLERYHSESPDFMKNVVVHGDVRDILSGVPDRSVHLTFTSPPYYNAREYSKYRSYAEYLDFLQETFREVHRVTKEGRFLVVNTSPVIVPRAGRKYSSRRYAVPYDLHPRLTGLGWEFIDDIVWAKPVTSVKNRVAGFEANRKPLTYKANARTEMVMVYRRRSHALIDWNLRQYPPDIVEKSKVLGSFERSNVWNIAPVSDAEHSAVFPRQLCENVIRLYSFVGDLVFDPFAGSGTVGLGALMNDRRFFLTELEANFVSVMRTRLLGHLTAPNESPRFIEAANFTAPIR